MMEKTILSNNLLTASNKNSTVANGKQKMHVLIWPGTGDSVEWQQKQSILVLFWLNEVLNDLTKIVWWSDQHRTFVDWLYNMKKLLANS